MSAPLSHITLDELKRLNSFALSDAPSSQTNLGRLIDELALSNDSRELCGASGYLVVGGRGVAEDRSYAEIEAALELPDCLCRPVEQASACVALLRFSPSWMQPPARHTQQQIQRRLSHLLVEYPVLLDPRLLFAVSLPHHDWTTLGCALAETSFASLPRLVDGFTEKQLRLFACNVSVKEGLTRPSPGSTSAPVSLLRSKTPLKVACGGVGTATAPLCAGATRGAFLMSLLYLNELASTFTKRGIVNPGTDTGECVELYRALGNVFWDVALDNARNTGATREEFVAAMKLRSPLAHAATNAFSDDEGERSVATARRGCTTAGSLLTRTLAMSIDGALFGVPGAMTKSMPAAITDAADMRERTTRVAHLLVDIGAADNHQGACQWLSDAAVGAGRMAPQFDVPHCTTAAAIGFMDALHAHGVRVKPAATPSTTLPLLQRAQAAADAEQTWHAAIEIFTATKSMEAVYQAHRSESASASKNQPPGDAVAAARARRRHL